MWRIIIYIIIYIPEEIFYIDSRFRPVVGVVSWINGTMIKNWVQAHFNLHYKN